MIVSAFSRFREYRADEGSAKIAGAESMIAALQTLQKEHEVETQNQKAVAALMIRGGRSLGLLRLFATHPPIEKRIAHLQLLAHGGRGRAMP